MARYRKIDLRLWADPRFLRLPPQQPSARALLLFLLAGPLTGQIPGVVIAGEATLAEALSWKLAALKRCMAQLEGEGIVKIDRQTRLVWLQLAAEHNEPANGSVLLGWRDVWEEVPACPLKDEVGQWLAARLASRFPNETNAVFTTQGEHDDRHRGGHRVPHRATLQEQEQEQEQDQEPPPNPPTGGGGVVGFEEFWKKYPKKQKKEAARAEWDRLAPGPELRATILASLAAMADSDEWRREQGRFIPAPAKWLSERRWTDEPAEGSSESEFERLIRNSQKLRELDAKQP